MKKTQVFSVGNYLMTGKVLGKGHFARVEEATHRIIGKKVAIKVIDLTSIKEDYARRNLHREPRVMAKLQHPCIAALYETMMHGPRLYVVMEAAGGGDLCSLVLSARGLSRGLPEGRARTLAAQLVSAVRHMHSRGVVHRDLKMENIMLDSTKQYIKIVDFGLSNMWSAGGTLQTPCGSLEYAAPELFVDGHKYGPEVDLWSIGVIVYGMVTGGLPFAGPNPEGGSRGQLRAAISKGFCRKQRAALAAFSTDCKTFIQHLLEPKVEQRMKIEEAARHRWVKRPGLRMKTHPFAAVDSKYNRELYRQIAELCGMSFTEVVSRIKSDPFGSTAGMYNIKIHLHQLQAGGMDLWTLNSVEPRPVSPPEYQAKCEVNTVPSQTIIQQIQSMPRYIPRVRQIEPKPPDVKPRQNDAEVNKLISDVKNILLQNPPKRPVSVYGLKKPIRLYGTGDGVESRLPCIEEHSNMEGRRGKTTRKVYLDEPRLNSCPNPVDKRIDFYKRGGDGLPSWRSYGVEPSSARMLFQSNATTIKRASLGNIVSPHSSSNSHCKSERSMPVGWHSSRTLGKESHLQRLRRMAPMK